MPEFPEKARLSAGMVFPHFGIETDLNGHLNGHLKPARRASTSRFVRVGTEEQSRAGQRDRKPGAHAQPQGPRCLAEDDPHDPAAPRAGPNRRRDRPRHTVPGRSAAPGLWPTREVVQVSLGVGINLSRQSHDDGVENNSGSIQVFKYRHPVLQICRVTDEDEPGPGLSSQGIETRNCCTVVTTGRPPAADEPFEAVERCIVLECSGSRIVGYDRVAWALVLADTGEQRLDLLPHDMVAAVAKSCSTGGWRTPRVQSRERGAVIRRAIGRPIPRRDPSPTPRWQRATGRSRGPCRASGAGTGGTDGQWLHRWRQLVASRA